MCLWYSVGKKRNGPICIVFRPEKELKLISYMVVCDNSIIYHSFCAILKPQKKLCAVSSLCYFVAEKFNSQRSFEIAIGTK